MSTQYVETQSPRFVVETNDGYERIVVTAQRNIFPMLFLPVWLAGWIFGALAAVRELLTKGFQPFLIFWLCGWALAGTFGLAMLCWMLAGKEIFRVIGPDLEISYRLLGLTRRKLYRGSAIRNLTSCEPPLYRYNQMSLPFFIANKSGSIRFTYGARSVYAAQGLDEAEGRLIIERLRKRLPSTATELVPQ